MAKSYSLAFISLFLLLFNSCQSIEQISIDYLQPADLSFPPQLRKVAVVNNTSDAPDNKLITEVQKTKENVPEVSRATAYANGDPKIAAESLAEEIAHQNYFDEVVICDSALRANDKLARENMLSQEEVSQLASDLGVDFIIALENLQFKATKTIRYLPDFNCYQGAMDVKVYPTVRVYVPGRSKPMTTLHPNDSIFWEDFGGSVTEAAARIIPEREMLKEAAEFAGTVPVRHLLPYWKTSNRYLFSGGSVNMRDAAVYAKEENWSKAVELWKQTYETKKGKQKMYAAYNTALGYEMQDSIDTALEWALKAQTLAREKSKTDKKETGEIHDGTISYYIFISMYVDELEKRKEGMARLNMQMNRFDDDF